MTKNSPVIFEKTEKMGGKLSGKKVFLFAYKKPFKPSTGNG